MTEKAFKAGVWDNTRGLRVVNNSLVVNYLLLKESSLESLVTVILGVTKRTNNRYQIYTETHNAQYMCMLGGIAHH